MSNEFKSNVKTGQVPAARKSSSQVPLHLPDTRGVADAIRAGGFACLFSEIIEPSWCIDKDVAGFPARIHFTARSEAGAGPDRAFVVSTYWVNAHTCREDRDEKTLRYVSESESNFAVEVTYCKGNRSWKATKYRGEIAFLWATGQDLRRLLIQLAWGRVQPGETVVVFPEHIDLWHEIRVVAAYTFTPSPVGEHALWKN